MPQMNSESVTRYPRASRQRRMAAFFFDHVVITFIMVLLAFWVIGPEMFETPGAIIRSVSMMLLIPLVIFVLYFGKDLYKGHGPGKWIFNIMVRKEEDHSQLPSRTNLFLRNLLLIIWPVEFFVMALNSKKKRLADQFFGTEVVRNPVKPSNGIRIAVIVGTCVLLLATSFFVFTGFTKNTAAYKTAIAEIEKNEEILAVTGGITSFGWFAPGNVNVNNGEGLASFRITVKGEEVDIMVSVELSKGSGEAWKIDHLEWQEDQKQR